MNGLVTACSEAKPSSLLREGFIDVLLSLPTCKLYFLLRPLSKFGRRGEFLSWVLLPIHTQSSRCPPRDTAQWLAGDGDAHWCRGVASVHASEGRGLMPTAGLDGSGTAGVWVPTGKR